MPSLFPLKNLPRYECLLRAAHELPGLDPSACEAYLHLLRAGHEAFQMSAGHFAKHRISQGGFMVLMLLLNRTRLDGSFRSTPAELAELAGVTRATMTGLVDTLERDGLVKRQPDPADRRMMTVHLTPRGRECLRRILPGHFQRMKELMSPLSEADRRNLVRLLHKLVQRTSAAEPRSAIA